MSNCIRTDNDCVSCKMWDWIKGCLLGVDIEYTGNVDDSISDTDTEL